LNPGGIFVQWVQAYEISDSTVGTILTTIGSQFAHVEAWHTLPSDMQLICSENPPGYTSAELRERISSKYIQDALEKCWSVYDLEGFLAHFVAGPDWARETAQTGLFALNTDDRTVIEYGFAKSVGRSAHLSMEGVRKHLRGRGYRVRALDDTSIDWNKVEVRRQEFNALYGGEMSVEQLPETKDQAYVRAVFDFAAGNYAAALEKWPADDRQPTDPMQRLLLAKCHAELARPEFLGLVDQVAEKYPTETAALRTIYHAGANEWPAAARTLNDLFSRLARDPWGVPGMVDSAIRQSARIAQGEPSSAAEIYDRLSRPFASYRNNYRRQVFRVFAAEPLGPAKVAEALVEMEPNVIWIPEALQLRASTYAALGHPLASRAQRDWSWYQSHHSALNDQQQ
jgi:hypothetical protein